MERSVCIICGKKRMRNKMVQYGQHWTCLSCINVSTEQLTSGRLQRIKVLNLYSGIGGNRFHWPNTLDITAVEINPKIAAEYKRNFPGDKIIIGDAHKYLIDHFEQFDIVCSSYPCQTHTRMNYIQVKKRYADLSLYQEIILLSSFFKGRYYVENVDPYYEPLIKPQFKLGRHLFWTNVPLLNNVDIPEFPEKYKGSGKGLMKMTKPDICKWLGIPPGETNIYISGKCKVQIYRNCIHPVLGKSIMNDILNSMTGGNKK